MIMLSCFIVLNVSAQQGQGLLTSPVALSLRNGDSLNMLPPAAGVFSLNSSSQQFKGIIDMIGIIASKDVADSIQRSGQLELKMEGTFPINNMDFLTISDNGKSADMEINCTLNGASKKQVITVTLIIIRDAPASNNGAVQKFPGRAAFGFVINPVDFGLDQPPFAVNAPVLINAGNSFLNKVNN